METITFTAPTSDGATIEIEGTYSPPAPNCFRDPFLISPEWTDGWAQTPGSLLAQQSDGANVLMASAEEITPGTYRLRIPSVTISTGGFRPLVGTDVHPTISTSGAVDMELTVTAVSGGTYPLIGFKDTDDTDAIINVGSDRIRLNRLPD